MEEKVCTHLRDRPDFLFMVRWQHVIIARSTRKRNTMRGERDSVSVRKGKLNAYTHLGRCPIHASAVLCIVTFGL